MGLLSNFQKIARVKLISAYPYHEPNAQLNIGLFNENMSSLPQIEMLKAIKFKPIVENTAVDSTYKNVAGAGVVEVPKTSEYWVGDMYGY